MPNHSDSVDNQDESLARQTWKHRDTAEWGSAQNHLVWHVGTSATGSKSITFDQKAAELRGSFETLGLVEDLSSVYSVGQAYRELLGSAIDSGYVHLEDLPPRSRKAREAAARRKNRSR